MTKLSCLSPAKLGGRAVRSVALSHKSQWVSPNAQAGPTQRTMNSMRRHKHALQHTVSKALEERPKGHHHPTAAERGHSTWASSPPSSSPSPLWSESMFVGDYFGNRRELPMTYASHAAITTTWRPLPANKRASDSSIFGQQRKRGLKDLQPEIFR